MNFNVYGKKVKITEPIQDYIEEKVGKLSKYFEKADEISANVTVRVRGVDQIIEVTIPTKNVILRGEASHHDLYAAIDLVSEKIESQIRKNKTKFSQRRARNYRDEILTDFEMSAEEEAKGQIVKRKKIDAKPMSEEEAILQMELLGHDFFVFKNSESLERCVLYKRHDGNFGLISISED